MTVPDRCGGVEDSESVFFNEQPGPFEIKLVEAA
jgi:hypothetical protein